MVVLHLLLLHLQPLSHSALPSWRFYHFLRIFFKLDHKITIPVSVRIEASQSDLRRATLHWHLLGLVSKLRDKTLPPWSSPCAPRPFPVVFGTCRGGGWCRRCRWKQYRSAVLEFFPALTPAPFICKLSMLVFLLDQVNDLGAPLDYENTQFKREIPQLVGFSCFESFVWQAGCHRSTGMPGWFFHACRSCKDYWSRDCHHFAGFHHQMFVRVRFWRFKWTRVNDWAAGYS